MASQIEQLRTHFNGLNTTQKKAFIDNLKQKIQGKKLPEYTKFLNECIKTYNDTIHKNASPTTGGADSGSSLTSEINTALGNIQKKLDQTIGKMHRGINSQVELDQIMMTTLPSVADSLKQTGVQIDKLFELDANSSVAFKLNKQWQEQGQTLQDIIDSFAELLNR